MPDEVADSILEDTAPSNDIRDVLERVIENGVDDTAEVSDDAAPPQAAEPASEPVSDERPRDASGRFLPNTQGRDTPETVSPPRGKAQAPVPDAPQPGVQGGPSKGLERPPQGWGPASRQHWNSLPPEVRAEAHKREGDFQRGFAEAAEFRRQATPLIDVARSFIEMSQPFLPIFQSEGMNVRDAFQNFLNVGYLLRQGPEDAKADYLATILQRFGISEHKLAAALDRRKQGGGQPGQQPPQYAQPQAQRPLADPRVDQLLQERRYEQYTAAQGQAQSFVDSGKAEFFDDVAAIMADIIDLKAKNRQPYTLEGVYQQAVRMHPEVSQILDQRREAEVRRTQAAERASRASVGLRPGGIAPDEPTEDNSIRANVIRHARGART